MNLNLTHLNIGFPWVLLLVVASYLFKTQRSFRSVYEGSMKALLGYYMIAIAASITPATTGAISRLMHAAFGVEGGVMNSEVYGAILLMKNGAPGFAAMFLAFGLNLLLARFTPLKGVFLTTHHYLYLALFAVTILLESTRLPVVAAVILGAVLLSVYGWLSIAATKGAIMRTTGMQDVGMANSSAEAALIGQAFGSIPGIGKKDYDSNGGKKTSLISSIPVAAGMSVLLTLIILCIFAGEEQARQILGEGSLLGQCAMRALLYGAQAALLLYGIRHLLTRVIELHWQLADRFVPGMWKGLDVSIMISYMPRAWEDGLLFSCLGGLLATVLMICFRAPFVPIVSPTSFYFSGGLAGVCGYTYGKKRGTRLAGFATGILATLAMGWMAAGLPAGTELGVMLGETQYGVFGLILQGISALLGWL